jgi:hypothetical protein
LTVAHLGSIVGAAQHDQGGSRWPANWTQELVLFRVDSVDEQVMPTQSSGFCWLATMTVRRIISASASRHAISHLTTPRPAAVSSSAS